MKENKRDVSQGSSSYLGLNLSEFGGSIPGFQMFKDRVIKPLIVATEKVVEYYLNDPTEQIVQNPEVVMSVEIK